jgi:hypothetical protein
MPDERKFGAGGRGRTNACLVETKVKLRWLHRKRLRLKGKFTFEQAISAADLNSGGDPCWCLLQILVSMAGRV